MSRAPVSQSNAQFNLADAISIASISHLDDSRSSWGLLGGYERNPWLAIEGGYRDRGEVQVQINATISDAVALCS